MREYEFSFKGPLEVYEMGSLGFQVVFLPQKVKKLLPFKKYPRLRIKGSVNGAPFEGAFQPAGSGKYYILVSKKLRKLADFALGDLVTVSFDIADQDAVEVPAELLEALDLDPFANKAWKALSAGRKRTYAHRVAGAKREETRESRVEEVIEILREMSFESEED